MFRHVVFDYHGAYYVAVPLDAPYNRIDPRTGRAALLRCERCSGFAARGAPARQPVHELRAGEDLRARLQPAAVDPNAIQKRLARQGSKFAGSQAFRVYRFRDGAWSDIILGAVMGAARRVEEEKRRRALAEERRLAQQGPILDTAMPPAREEPKRPAFETAVPANDRTATRDAWSDLGDTASSTAISARRAGQKNGANGARSNARGGYDGLDTRRAADRDETEEVQMDHRDARPDEKDRSQFGAYAQSARAELNSCPRYI